jgi:hypothetical protein
MRLREISVIIALQMNTMKIEIPYGALKVNKIEMSGEVD